MDASIPQYLHDVHPARLSSAFAKADPQRQGQLGFSDFASVLRRLGVPATVAPPLKGGTGSSWDPSQGAIDYEAFVTSLGPGGAQPRGPALGGAADAAVRAVVRSTRHGPATMRRHYGAHSPAQGGAVREVMSSGGTSLEPSLALHTHSSFGLAAGLDAQTIASHSAHGQVAQQQAAAHPRSTRRPTDAPQAQPLAGAVLFGQESAAGVPGALGAASPRRRPPESSSPCLRSNVNRVVFGHDVDGSEAKAGAALARPSKGRPAGNVPPSMRSEADNVIFGRDLDGADNSVPLGASAAFCGAAGCDSGATARCHSPPQPQSHPLRPSMRSSADSLIFGRDLGGSGALQGCTRCTRRSTLHTLQHAP